METYGFNARDVKDHCMKIYFAQVEIVLYSIEGLEQRRIWKKYKRYQIDSWIGDEKKLIINSLIFIKF